MGEKFISLNKITHYVGKILFSSSDAREIVKGQPR